jgi:hypothetical protein
MDQKSTAILRIVIVGIGLAVLAVCSLLLPMAIATDNVGYYRPILYGLYLPAVPFYIALFQSMKILGLVDKNLAFSSQSIQYLHTIKVCALAISGLFTVGMPYIYYAAERDDAPGVILIGLIIIFASFVISAAAAVFQKLMQSAVEIKSENDLTV